MKLDDRIKQYDIPEIPYLPIHKDVLIYRIPAKERTAGGIYIPERDNEPKSYGVLIAAGLGARDVMYDHLIELGDVVWFGTYEGDEKEVAREVGADGQKLLQMKIEGIRGSVDAIERAKDYDIVRDDDGKHMYQLKTKKRKAA